VRTIAQWLKQVPRTLPCLMHNAASSLGRASSGGPPAVAATSMAPPLGRGALRGVAAATAGTNRLGTGKQVLVLPAPLPQQSRGSPRWMQQLGPSRLQPPLASPRSRRTARSRTSAARVRAISVHTISTPPVDPVRRQGRWPGEWEAPASHPPAPPHPVRRQADAAAAPRGSARTTPARRVRQRGGWG